MNPILEKLRKNSRIKESDVLVNSKFFKPRATIKTDIPMMNVALSGNVDGGLGGGILALAGPSKNFKTGFSLILASAFLREYPDGALLFYDSEFGSPQGYFESFGIDTSKVLHTPIKNVEELKFDLVNQLGEITDKDRVMIVIDSVGNLASKKEVDDAINENSAADMSRAKALKSFFRMITPDLAMKNIPLVTINHTYQEQKLYGKQIMSGGEGGIYSSNAIWFIGKQQDKDGTEIMGYNFVITINKSRFVKEGSKIPIHVSWKGGVEKYSGLLEVALEGGYVIKPKNGWYTPVNPDTKTPLVEKSFREKDTYNAEFWDRIFDNTNFADFIELKYKLPTAGGISDGTDELLEAEEE